MVHDVDCGGARPSAERGPARPLGPREVYREANVEQRTTLGGWVAPANSEPAGRRTRSEFAVVPS